MGNLENLLFITTLVHERGIIFPQILKPTFVRPSIHPYFSDITLLHDLLRQKLKWPALSLLEAQNTKSNAMQFVLSRAICFVHPKSPFLLMATSTSVSSVSSIAIPRKARLRGVVFDMDGTLTVPVIDFPAMYRSVLGEDEYLSVKAKNPTGIDILHQIENWSPEKQRKAYETITDFERQGLDRLQIMPGWLLFLWKPVWLLGKCGKKRKRIFVYCELSFINCLDCNKLWMHLPFFS